MCTIYGVIIAPDSPVKTDPTQLALLKALVVKNFYELEGRGRDASGMFLLDNDKHWKLTKAPIASANMAYLAEFGRTVDTISAKTNFVLGHARAKTKGSEYNNLNNHPIEYRGLVGVHNGTIGNDDKVFTMTGAERFGEVDSEAIFASIYSLAEDITAVKKEELQEALSILTGGCASLVASINNPNQLLFIKETNPMDLLYFEKLGVLMVVSDRSFISEAANSFRLMRNWLGYEIDTSMLNYTYTAFPISSAGILDLQKMNMENMGKIHNYTDIFTIKVTPKETPATNNADRGTERWNGYYGHGAWTGNIDDDYEETCWICGKKLPEEELDYNCVDWKYTCKDCAKNGNVEKDGKKDDDKNGNVADPPEDDNEIEGDIEEEEDTKPKVSENQTELVLGTELAALPPAPVNSMSKTLPLPIHQSLGEENINKISSHVATVLQHFVIQQDNNGVGRGWHRALNYDLKPPFQVGSLNDLGFRKDAGVGREAEQKWRTQGEAYEIGFIEGMYKGAWAAALQCYLLGKTEG